MCMIGVSFCTGVLIGNQSMWSSILGTKSSLDENFGDPQPLSFTRAIVLTSFCSGSEFITKALNATQGINFGTEELIKVSNNATLWKTISWPDYERKLEEAFIRVSSANQESRVSGFKLMFDQIPSKFYSEFAGWLNRRNIHVIHLRRNAALQLASDIQKIERRKVTGENIGHVYNSSKIATLHQAARIPVVATYNWVRLLEENQRLFADYLEVHAACVPILEVFYENLEGHSKQIWFDLLAVFLGIQLPRKEKEDGTLLPVKVGSVLCEDRVTGIGIDYEHLANLTSQKRCLTLRHRQNCNAGISTTSTKLFLPPAVSTQCRYTGGNCGAAEQVLKYMSHHKV